MRFSRFAALVLSLVTALSLALPAQAAEGDGWLIPNVKDTPSFTDTVGSGVNRRWRPSMNQASWRGRPRSGSTPRAP